MKTFRRKLGMILRLARRGAWKGVRRFSAELLWALTHRHCRQCGAKKQWPDSRCATCQWNNLLRALDEVDEEDGDEDCPQNCA